MAKKKENWRKYVFWALAIILLFVLVYSGAVILGMVPCSVANVPGCIPDSPPGDECGPEISGEMESWKLTSYNCGGTGCEGKLEAKCTMNSAGYYVWETNRANLANWRCNSNGRNSNPDDCKICQTLSAGVDPNPKLIPHLYSGEHEWNPGDSGTYCWNGCNSEGLIYKLPGEACSSNGLCKSGDPCACIRIGGLGLEGGDDDDEERIKSFPDCICNEGSGDDVKRCNSASVVNGPTNPLEGDNTDLWVCNPDREKWELDNPCDVKCTQRGTPAGFEYPGEWTSSDGLSFLDGSGASAGSIMTGRCKYLDSELLEKSGKAECEIKRCPAETIPPILSTGTSLSGKFCLMTQDLGEGLQPVGDPHPMCWKGEMLPGEVIETAKGN